VLVDGGYVRLSDAPREHGQNVAHERLSATVTVSEPSYVYTYLSNEEPTESPIDVYFDDFAVTQVTSNVVAGGDYYSFGLPMDTRQITQENYRFGYQGQFAEKDSITNWNSFQLRMYDARFGRWISPDPYGQFSSPYVGMGNEPNMSTDSDGGWNTLASFATGFVAGGITAGVIARQSGSSVKEAFLFGLAGGLAGGTIGAVINNLGGFESSLRQAEAAEIPLSDGSNKVSILINNNGGKLRLKRILNSNGGVLGGHVAISIGKMVYGFTSDKNNIKRSLINTDGDDDGFNRVGVHPDTWHSGGVLEEFGNSPSYSSGFDTRFDIPVTDEQRVKILEEVRKISLNPPDYGTLRARCTSVAARILRAGKVLPRQSISIKNLLFNLGSF
jgi:RHS repeat-associated protein